MKYLILSSLVILFSSTSFGKTCKTTPHLLTLKRSFSPQTACKISGELANIAPEGFFVASSPTRFKLLRSGMAVVDLNGDQQKELVLTVKSENKMFDLIILNVREDGSLSNFKYTSNADEFFEKESHGYKVMKLDFNTTINVKPREKSIVLGDKIHKNFKTVLKFSNDGTLEVDPGNSVEN